MNGFKLLTIEYDGIYGIIVDYTSDSKVINYLSKYVPYRRSFHEYCFYHQIAGGLRFDP